MSSKLDKQLIDELKNEVFNLRSVLAAAREQKLELERRAFDVVAAATVYPRNNMRLSIYVAKLNEMLDPAVDYAALSPSQPTPDAGGGGGGDKK